MVESDFQNDSDHAVAKEAGPDEGVTPGLRNALLAPVVDLALPDAGRSYSFAGR